MSKVYCKNCKWNEMVWITRCFCVSDLKAKPGKIFHEDEIRESANKNNDCPLYERKWWKIWIK